MSLRNRLVLPIVLSTIAVLVGCGSSTNNPTPPPTGGFSNTNFNGTYVFSVFGQNGNGTFAMAGSFAACGCAAGTISGGTVDVVDPTVVASASTIGSGSVYQITPDGRGKAKLAVTNTTVGLNEVFELDFVLTSSLHGLIIRFDGNGTGSGTIDLQPSVIAQSAIANTPLAFSFSGTDASASLAPLASVGAFTLNSSGNINTSGATAGVTDINYSFGAHTAVPLSGSVTVGSSTTPGLATLLASGFGTLTFDVYPIDGTHLKIIENDGSGITVGDVFTQPSTSIPSTLVFTMAGYDSVGASPFVVGGLISTDGSSTITSGLEDINEGGVVDGGTNTPLSFGGNFAATPVGSGRFQFNLAGFGGGTVFAAYPSSGGVLMLEIDAGLNPGITGGVAMAQTGTTITAQGYGLNLTGQDPNGELDVIAEFTATSTGLKGLLDENEGFATNTHNFTGNYSVDSSSGAGSATQLSSGLAGMFFYVANGSTALFISTDSNQVALGSFQLQSTPTAVSNMAQQQLAVLRSVRSVRPGSQNRKSRFGRAN